MNENKQFKKKIIKNYTQYFAKISMTKMFVPPAKQIKLTQNNNFSINDKM